MTSDLDAALLAVGPVELADRLESGVPFRPDVLARLLDLAADGVRQALDHGTGRDDFARGMAWARVDRAIRTIIERETGRTQRAERGAIDRREPDGTCRWCGTDVGPRALFCSAQCRQREYRDRLRRYGETPAPPTEWRCEHCGVSLHVISEALQDAGGRPLRSDARFCGSDCRVAAHRARTRVTDSVSSH